MTAEPYAWDAAPRHHLRARLDALYCILYGISHEDEQRHHGVYLTKELILGYMNALAAGDTITTLAYPAP